MNASTSSIGTWENAFSARHDYKDEMGSGDRTELESRLKGSRDPLIKLETNVEFHNTPRCFLFRAWSLIIFVGCVLLRNLRVIY